MLCTGQFLYRVRPIFSVALVAITAIIIAYTVHLKNMKAVQINKIE